MFDKLDEVVRRYEMLTERLADPSLYDRQTEYKEVSSERANIEEIVQTYIEYKKVKEDYAGAKQMLMDESDPELREMAKEEVSEKKKLK